MDNRSKCGHWKWDENGMDWGLGAWRCSKCGLRPAVFWNTMHDINPMQFSSSGYCPNCGAKMEGSET